MTAAADAARAIAGSLAPEPALERLDLVADPVAAALRALPATLAADCLVAAIDPDLADTAAFCEAYGSPLEASANCVVVAGARSGERRFAACVVLATTRADVNTVVRRRLDVRKASFAPMDEAVELTGMAYGGITPFGVPTGWPVLVDAAVLATPAVVVGSGLRESKLLVPGAVLGEIPGAEVIEGLGR
ncbi:prolyl-tRNA editing enzyme YbaK/EbsC (Cys-tRNA(Pro) deacylase) [Actinomycetospora succinea]|uniref:Prolyl-tRNA editing enzyme YbaK/EbsC (Cys-tRNA(Pro) deacylase) n=1 Tax=Actinomycetospora succinea TaxID=663603 RepID=A0A4V3D8S4_9PSEU|nr:YbaK/EbsC family protein [Actinomycetospora succinea]TDQ52871.1 prolyl-tRNA editing enzyme YbaK/EbsC (Cys-tRNA(Pro) deacylase) [Actinomycetospora succinea]